MPRDLMATFLDNGLKLADYLDNLSGFPQTSRDGVRMYVDASITSGDADWALYYMWLMMHSAAGATAHMDVRVDEIGQRMFGIVREESSQLRMLVVDGKIPPRLQQELRDWQEKNNISPKGHRDDRPPYK